MDLNRAIQFGLLVKAAEDVPPASTANAAGQTIAAQYDPNNIGYKGSLGTRSTRLAMREVFVTTWL